MSGPEQAARIERVRRELDSSGMPTECADGLHDMLTLAGHVSNGTPDKIAAIAQSVSLILLHQVRTEIRQPARIAAVIQDAVGKQAEACAQRFAALAPPAQTPAQPLDGINPRLRTAVVFLRECGWKPVVLILGLSVVIGVTANGALLLDALKGLWS